MSATTKRGPGRPRFEWPPDVVARLGVDRDEDIARDIGRSVSAVAGERRRRGIRFAPKPHRPSRAAGRVAALVLDNGPMWLSEVAERIGVTRQAVSLLIPHLPPTVGARLVVGKTLIAPAGDARVPVDVPVGADRKPRATRTARLLDMAARPGGVTAREAAELFPTASSPTLARLCNEGRLVRVAHGRYVRGADPRPKAAADPLTERLLDTVSRRGIATRDDFSPREWCLICGRRKLPVLRARSGLSVVFLPREEP